MRELTYVDAICEAHHQLLASDPSVFVIGQGLWSPWYAGRSLADLDKRFGRERVIDTPISENAVTAAALGAALQGMKPIVFHPRMDFMLLAMDPLVNQASNWNYMFDGQVKVPLTVRASIARGGGQGAQHSQALHAFFVHVPGIKVVMPAVASDAKALLVAAVHDPNPVLYIDDRWCFEHRESVPEEVSVELLGRAAVRREGADATIVSVGYGTLLALQAAQQLAADGIDAEIVDLRTIKPWDSETVLGSVEKTRRAVIVDVGWITGSISSEIATEIVSALWGRLEGPPIRVALPDAPAPTSEDLERIYYPSSDTVVEAVRIALGRTPRPKRFVPSRRVPGFIRA